MVRPLNKTVYEYCGGVMICLFVVDVDIKQLLLCTGGHAVFLRAALLVSVIKDMVDYKLLQHRNNCQLYLEYDFSPKGS